MSRPLRITYPGAFYHITSRGNEQKAVFKGRQDRTKFLEYLKSASERYSCRERGGQLNFGAINIHDKSTTVVAINYFGSWDAAMARIGINTAEYRQQASGKSLSSVDVTEELKERQKTGLPLNGKAIKSSPLQCCTSQVRLLFKGS